MQPDPGEVSQLLRAWGKGDVQARESLIPLVYRELRRRAGAYLRRERPDHTLQATALVHEAYVHANTRRPSVPAQVLGSRLAIGLAQHNRRIASSCCSTKR